MIILYNRLHAVEELLVRLTSNSVILSSLQWIMFKTIALNVYYSLE